MIWLPPNHNTELQQLLSNDMPQTQSWVSRYQHASLDIDQRALVVVELSSDSSRSPTHGHLVVFATPNENIATLPSRYF